MWNDIETTQDLLNFKVIADVAAQMIKDSNGEPVSIGVSGSWGVGKSSLVQMIGESLKSLDDGKNYIFINFNAWLYQGYDDARMALLQKVADKIMEESESRETCIDKAKEFIKRINWLRTAKFMAPVATGIITGGAVAGPVGSFIGAVSGLFDQNGMPSQEDLSELKDSYNQIAPDLRKLINNKEEKSVPKEIAALRALFQELLEKLELTLVVLVDDLDRCLPNTAISTLEAMRLLLFIPQTAFIIAADEQMIRNAVKSHFGNSDLNDELITSYFDKLIQIPLRVPRLGANEVKGYLILLLADLAKRRDQITQEEKDQGHNAIISAMKKSWAGGLTKKVIEDAYGDAAVKLANQIDLADQLANIMATSDHIAGNPRLIKRFLNNLTIRQSVAKAQEMSVSFEELVKLQLFERCAPAVAFEYLAKQVGESEDGKPKFLQELEEKVAKAEELKFPDKSWETPFISDWLKLSPPLSDIDLRPLLYLSRDKAISLASFDELSSDGRELLSALCETKSIMQALINTIKQIGLIESEKILTRMKRRARNKEWSFEVIMQTLHLPKAFPELSSSFVAMLDEIPAGKRPVQLIPQLLNEKWAKELLESWKRDDNTPITVKKAINISRRKN
ncbi:P-loop NTPase fold protein [Otariodibacter sp.]|uniref:KAP family P-loop NTPase fold protein n=1 Tax=Otariodibacter sp. TaxID=3030919 RepID=UPI002628EE98|nr:P-loop NTPase fold protein [Otariodibacter sp.]